MLKQLTISVRVTIIMLIVVSGVYPMVVWAIAQTAFSKQANGDLVRDSSGTVIGSELLAQGFAKPQYFQPRPSAAGSGYDPTASGGTNLGPTSDKLINGVHKPNAKNGTPDPSDYEGVKDLANDYRKTNGLPANIPVPVDAVTRSASGLDPDISQENARLQSARVAQARGIPVAQVAAMVDKYTRGRDLGFIGEPRVNVLLLNLALDKSYPVNK
jgi:K+-transporting ATPase ATPase C chain